MVKDGIKAARIQARYSELNSSWSAGPFQSMHVVSAIKQAMARLNPHLSGQRPAGRHAAPGRMLLTRHVPH
jgi:hypothetical protein